MNADDAWALFGAVFGLASGILLSWSAVRGNKLLREAWELREMLVESHSGLERQTFDKMQKKAQEQASTWDNWDERRLYWGIYALVLSFFCSLLSSVVKANII